MIVKALGQLLLAVSLFHIAPFDATLLEAQVDEARPATDVAHLLLSSVKSAHLPVSDDRKIPPPKKVDAETFGVVTSADSVIVVDRASGTTLYAENPDDVRPMGSITKLMTAMVFLDTKPNLSGTVFLTPDDYVGGGRVYLQFNDPVLLKHVLGASLVGSDNTATQALARLSGFTLEEFVSRMNEKAYEIGMSSTSFVDPSGLSSQNVSTARDLSLLIAEAEKYEAIHGLIQKSEYLVTQHSGFSVNISSTNVLLTTPLNSGEYSITGGKTGYIPQAGYCLATTVEHDGNEVVIVVLGAQEKDDRFKDASALAVWSFKTFVWPKL